MYKKFSSTTYVTLVDTTNVFNFRYSSMWLVPNCDFKLHILINNDVAHLYSCLFSIRIPYLVNNLFTYFTNFLIKLLVFLLLSFDSSLHILIQILYKDFILIACLCIFLTVSFKEQKFSIFLISILFFCPFIDCASGTILKSLPNPLGQSFIL